MKYYVTAPMLYTPHSGRECHLQAIARALEGVVLVDEAALRTMVAELAEAVATANRIPGPPKFTIHWNQEQKYVTVSSDADRSCGVFSLSYHVIGSDLNAPMVSATIRGTAHFKDLIRKSTPKQPNTNQ